MIIIAAMEEIVMEEIVAEAAKIGIEIAILLVIMMEEMITMDEASQTIILQVITIQTAENPAAAKETEDNHHIKRFTNHL
jgi:hypothetical protein